MQDRSWVLAQERLVSNRGRSSRPGLRPGRTSTSRHPTISVLDFPRGADMFAALSVWFPALFLPHVVVADLALGGDVSCSVSSRAASLPLGFRAETRGGWYACSMNR